MNFVGFSTFSPLRYLALIYWSTFILTINGSSANNNDNNGTTNLPNFIIMLMDDMGWGDLGCFGEPNKETPHLDQMAREGMIFTDFYAANPLCSPSRASLLTGRLPIRNGFYTDNAHARNAYTQDNAIGGIDQSEILVSELLAEKGYRNKIIGKWHLGRADQFMPLKHGFHEFFGSPDVHFGPYNDVDKPNIAFFKDDTMIGRYYENIVIDPKTRLSNLTQMFIQEAVTFIKAQNENKTPFFLYWTPDSSHGPVYASQQFRGKSKRGLYGDAVMELDSGVGIILDTLKTLGIDNNTFVFFTSDNGPALVDQTQAGSNGPFLCGKQTTFEGGMREPALAWWPGKIKPDTVSHQTSSVMDLFSTVLDMAGKATPTDRIIDGVSLTNTLFKGEEIKRPIFYYRGNELMATRLGSYKAHFWTWTNSMSEFDKGIDFCPGQVIKGITDHAQRNYTTKPKLYHLGRDPAERFHMKAESAEYKKAMKAIMIEVNNHRTNLVKGKPVFDVCDNAAQPWAPTGCELIGKCLPVPKSNPHLCNWPH